jgi:uncharacterized membrane protein YhaH (DUF805 family)
MRLLNANRRIQRWTFFLALVCCAIAIVIAILFQQRNYVQIFSARSGYLLPVLLAILVILWINASDRYRAAQSIFDPFAPTAMDRSISVRSHC